MTRALPPRLHHYLLLRVGLVLLVLLLGGALLLPTLAHRSHQAKQEALATTLERLLEKQFVGFVLGTASGDAAPDWSVVSMALAGTRGCARLMHPDGSLWRSECRAAHAAEAGVPAWFSAAYRAVFDPRRPLERSLEDAHGRIALLQWEPDRSTEIAIAWHDLNTLGGLMLGTALGVGALLYVLGARALAPLTPLLDRLRQLGSSVPEAVGIAPAIAELEQLEAAIDALGARLQDSEQARQRFAAQAVAAQDLEREHLARELHDELGQQLAGLSALAAGLQLDAAGQAPALAPQAARIEVLLAGMQAELRELLRFLRPPALAEEGLHHALQGLARHWQAQLPASQSLTVRLDAGLDGLPPATAHHVYRIVQEGLSNSARHGRGQAVAVSLSIALDPTTGGRLLEICFEAPAAAEEAPGSGLGRIGIAERAALLGGRVVFDSAGGQPLHVQVPLPATGAA